jgi:hypothetical protein
MRQVRIRETHRLAYRQIFLHSYRKAGVQCHGNGAGQKRLAVRARHGVG